MVHKTEDMPHLFRENLRGGHGPVETDVVYGPEDLAGKATLFNHMTVKPGSSIGRHAHVQDAEIYYVLEGEVVVDDDGKEVTMHKGDAMFTSRGEHHSLENRSDRDAVVLAIVIA
ncbi:MAG: cupin domain-containing protein [Ruminococcaceae bacterium]|nr:cupin domain-containing protein [Oscillospiraceae bacterium]